jgi:peptidoglycan/LPS O-acetylase OafA/YrhL
LAGGVGALTGATCGSCSLPLNPSKSHPWSKSLNYRPDIQILRAVAVLLVLLFHLQVPGFGSGFLGVDVFFVISGYLMQALYGQGITAGDFYKRRARRLLPAYFGLVLATLFVCAVVTLPDEFDEAVTQSLWASMLSSNIGYWLDVSYFETTQFRPLLHLWSLGVECQFYLLFPLLLRLNRRWLALVSLISLAACFAALTVTPKLPFFMMPLRIWEFALGMFAARMPSQGDRRIGLAALAAIVLTLAIPVDGAARNVFTGHPGLPALAITALTAVALVCRFPAALERSLPGVAAQRVGDASYSLYLAHFPIIVLLNYEPFSGTHLGLAPWTLPLIAVATLALYFGLERQGPKLFSVRRSFGAIAAVWVAAALLEPAQLLRFNQRQRLIFAAAHDRSAYHCGKLFRVAHPRQKFCLLDRGKPVMLVGDSHADALKLSFAKVAEKHGWGVYFPIDNDVLLSPNLSASWLRKQADALGARWVFVQYSPLNYSAALIEAARRELGSRLIVIEPTPIFPDSVPKMLFEKRPLPPAMPNQQLEAYLKAHPDIRVVRIMPALCGASCRLTDAAGHPLYWDRDHLTLTGARQLEPAFDAMFRALRESR